MPSLCHRSLALLTALLYLQVGVWLLVPAMGYWANETYISQELCINQNRPELNCNGHCQLAKSYQQQAEQLHPTDAAQHQQPPSLNLQGFSPHLLQQDCPFRGLETASRRHQPARTPSLRQRPAQPETPPPRLPRG
jgi:hypothetical protein